MAKTTLIAKMESLNPQLPEDPLAFMQACGRTRRIFWTYHVNMRLQGRFIARESVIDAVDTYELVESYPQDKYLPSSLILAHDGGEAIHVVFATDVAEDHVRLVTAYRPRADAWEGDD